ncbi:conserved protein of unknown function [Magnetospirillum sp. XM-1]|uniref:glycosyltransferase family 4 protein n=1 Tax=Magnetospirillum sp. XM-1 TaxID=1663591 RepID=UPI00073DEFC2|nr:glycosyltransferase family 4 protein [Magnetospirillum sp. XM-1]CUW37798.1 conserved protein of unknown function [Magnetospirillum sp. XM-1]
MRVLFYDAIGWAYDADTPYNEPLGGTQSAVAYLTAELAAQGIEVTVANDVPAPIRSRNVDFVPLRGMSPERMNGFDVVVVLLGALAEDLRRSGVRVPLVLWAHHAPNEPDVQKLKMGPERSAWSGYVMVSQWQADRYVAAFGLPRDRIKVIGNAVPPSLAAMPLAPAWFDTGEAPVLVYTSTPFRGLETLLIGFPSLRRAVPDVTLHVYSGMNVYRKTTVVDCYDSLYELARALPGVEYKGVVGQSELAGAIASAAGMAYPCIWAETSCIAAMEVMAAGGLILSTVYGAIPETTAGYGHLLPLPSNRFALPGEWAAMAAKTIEECRRNPDAARKRREEQAAFTRKNYAWPLRATQWVDYLRTKIV